MSPHNPPLFSWLIDFPGWRQDGPPCWYLQSHRLWWVRTRRGGERTRAPEAASFHNRLIGAAAVPKTPVHCMGPVASNESFSELFTPIVTKGHPPSIESQRRAEKRADNGTRCHAAAIFPT